MCMCLSVKIEGTHGTVCRIILSLFEPRHEKTGFLHMQKQQELSHDSIARLNCALPITKTISVIR